MNKNLFYAPVFFLIFLIGCNDEKPPLKLKVSDILSIAFSRTLIHVQTPTSIEYLKKNSVRAIAEIIEGKSIHGKDSVTFTKYGRNGLISSRTTSECSSMGCTTYDIHQKFIYSNDTIKTMNDYHFRFKKKSSLDYWFTTDTSRLRFVYDERYRYDKDSIFVDTMPSEYKYVKDKHGKINEISWVAKTNAQFLRMIYSYTDSTIERNTFGTHGESIKLVYFYNEKNNSVVRKIKHGGKIVECFFDNNGLIKEILYFKNGAIEKKKRLKYYYYAS